MRTRRLPDRVKRSLFMLPPFQQTQRPLQCTLGKSCRKEQPQKHPLIRAVTVIIIIALLKLMKNYTGIHPWNMHGKVPIPSELLVISLWKSIVGVNVNLTPFSFDISAKLIERKKNTIQARQLHRWANEREDKSVWWRDMSGNILFWCKCYNFLVFLFKGETAIMPWAM